MSQETGDSSEILSLATHSQLRLLVTADKQSRLKLFDWPAAKKQCKYKEYVSHSSYVLACAFVTPAPEGGVEGCTHVVSGAGL